MRTKARRFSARRAPNGIDTDYFAVDGRLVRNGRLRFRFHEFVMAEKPKLWRICSPCPINEVFGDH